MKKTNLIRSILMTALLMFGILIFGTESKIFADGGGTIGSGTRSGYLGSGNRSEAPISVEENQSDLQSFIDTFYELIF